MVTRHASYDSGGTKTFQGWGKKYSGLDFIHLVPQVHVIYKNFSVNSTNTNYNAFSESLIHRILVIY